MPKLALILIIILFTASTQADTYRWVNEDGVVTYSQTPPPEGHAEKVKTRNTTSSDSAESGEKLKQLQQKLADMDEDRALQKAEREEQAKDKAMREGNCQAARHNLEQLTALGNRLYKVGDDYLRLSEEERQARMQEAREQIKEYCK
ncbi:MAG: DUF4124 domain-containing protein [Candidatus Thiodiazotropha sp.]